MSKDLQKVVFSVFCFAVSPNHVKLTVNGKMAREAHMDLGGPQEAEHIVEAAYMAPTVALSHRTNGAPPAACRAKRMGSQVSNLSDSIFHLHGILVFLCLWN